eukprot:8635-Eustigmatos_ZCMA.PRE.1
MLVRSLASSFNVHQRSHSLMLHWVTQKRRHAGTGCDEDDNEDDVKVYDVSCLLTQTPCGRIVAGPAAAVSTPAFVASATASEVTLWHDLRM